MDGFAPVNDQSNKVPKNKSREKATQEQRLRAALRENLKRRRAQAAFASPGYAEAYSFGEKYAKFRIYAVEGLPQQ